MLEGKKIVLGVSGGIAIYKVVDLVSKLRKRGAEVRVVMTEHATKFVSPLLFSEISGYPAAVSSWEGGRPDSSVEHIALAEWGDLMVLAPATANILAKAACGLADDLLSTTFLAAACAKVVFPAMNTGRDLRFLVTAAGTREPIDPVRYVGNRSSGKMGYAIAREALLQGADVTLVTGPSALTPPPYAKVIRVETTQEMLAACLDVYPEVDVVIKAAAVADFKPRDVADQKIKKINPEEGMTVVMDQNPDILKILGARKEKQFLVGFAAETQNLLANAAEKVRKKNLDMIVANDVSQAGAGFNTDTNIVKFLYPDGTVESLDMMTKDDVALRLLDRVLERRER